MIEHEELETVKWDEEKNRDLEAERWVKEKLEKLIKPMFGVECIVLKEDEKIKGAAVTEVFPVPRFAKLFKEPIRSEGCTLDTLAAYSKTKRYNLEELIQTLKNKLNRSRM